jgi:N6-adenosine-specific RNA methylase IME4
MSKPETVEPQADARADQTYGALLEGVHIAGYTFERACAKLEWLLEADRWRGVGGGFDDVNKFLASIKLDSFRTVAEQRKRIAQRIKQLQPRVSNRAIAKTLGADERTVRRDTAANAAPAAQNASKINEGKASPAANAAPVLAGAAAAKLVVRRENVEERRAERIERIAEISKGNTPLPTGQRYPVILADPPWRFESFAGDETPDHAAKYPTMTLDEVCALPVCDLVTNAAILFLWTTAPHLIDHAPKVIEAWGFKYSTCQVWDKTGGVPGLGHIVRIDHEHLLIARRGDFPSPPPAVRPSSVIRSPKREHSRKPDEVYGIIERMYPTLPRIELFARHARSGWAAWGNQIASDAMSPAMPAADDGLDIPGFVRRSAAS